MADLKISQLTVATTPLAGTEVLPIVQGGATVKVSISGVTAGRAVSAASIIAELGAVGTPSYTFTGDLNTGMWSPGADTLAFSTAGSERGRIDSSGNVGIGTSSPGKTLDLVGQFRASGSAGSGYALLEYGTSGTASNNWHVGAEGDGTFRWYNGNLGGGTERMRITSSGDVGIGAVPNASAVLDVQSTTKGLRLPNMTTAQKNNIASPAAGLMVFDTTLSKACVYSGAAWETITSV